MRVRPAYKVKLCVSYYLTPPEQWAFELGSRQSCILLPRYFLPLSVTPTTASWSPHIPDKVQHYEVSADAGWLGSLQGKTRSHVVLPTMPLDRVRVGSTVLVEMDTAKPPATFVYGPLVHSILAYTDHHTLHTVCGQENYTRTNELNTLDVRMGGTPTCAACLARPTFWMPSHVLVNDDQRRHDLKAKAKQVKRIKAREKIPTAIDRIMYGWTPFDEAEPDPFPDVDDEIPPVSIDLNPDETEEYVDPRETRRANRSEKISRRR